MDNRPIGIFDSGVGGLTAAAALRRLMPEENIIYFADSGRVPYGEKSVPALRKMTEQDLNFVSLRGAKAIIAACGTVSSNAPDILAGYEKPVVGVLEPSIAEMAQYKGAKALGVIATAASIASGVFKRKLETACPGCEIIDIACPDFVPLIESGHYAASDDMVMAAVEKYLKVMKEAEVGALLLGCTHYGLIANAISDYLGDGVALVSAADCAAKAMRERILSLGIEGAGAQERYYTSGTAEEFSCLASTLLGYDVAAVTESVPVMEV